MGERWGAMVCGLKKRRDRSNPHLLHARGLTAVEPQSAVTTAQSTVVGYLLSRSKLLQLRKLGPAGQKPMENAKVHSVVLLVLANVDCYAWSANMFSCNGSVVDILELF